MLDHVLIVECKRADARVAAYQESQSFSLGQSLFLRHLRTVGRTLRFLFIITDVGETDWRAILFTVKGRCEDFRDTLQGDVELEYQDVFIAELVDLCLEERLRVSPVVHDNLHGRSAEEVQSGGLGKQLPSPTAEAIVLITLFDVLSPTGI